MRALEACYFDSEWTSEWAKLARVLESTAAQHCPEWRRRVVQLKPITATRGTGITYHIANTQKLEHWRDCVDAAPDNAELLFLDADTMILRGLDAVWADDFEIAYTIRPGFHLPFNLGVFFVRVTDRVRQFFTDWVLENERMFQNGDEPRAWRTRFGGVNQAAFGSLLESGRLADVRMKALLCSEWNCEESTWPTFDQASARIVHVKGDLRHMVFHRRSLKAAPALESVVRLWRETYKALGARPAISA
jgi:hypothetical protein